MGDANRNSTLTTRSMQKSQTNGRQPIKTIPFYRLFSFADSRDKVLMTIGTIGAIGNGFAQPLVALIFGELIDAFGKAPSHDIVSHVSKVCIKYVYLALGCGTAAFLQMVCWMVTGEKQAARIRSLYLKTILGQEIAYYDQQVSTGEVIEMMSGDTVLIHDAIGEKVGKFIQVVASFLGGILIALVKGWLLTLVMLSSLALIVISGGLFHFVRARNAFKSRNSYADAANLAHQTISSIRTIASFTGEKQAVAKYKKFLTMSYKSEISIALSSGLGSGFFLLFLFFSYGLGLWYGARMILHKGYSGGEVFTVLLAVIIGSASAGQASPSLAAFTSGQAAAFKMFETMDRKPLIDAYDTKGKVLNEIRGDIELKDVCFSYPSRPIDQIFNGFSLLIPSGTTTALVGQSGSGKSTVISLIERFYDPLSGAVLVDGIDLRDFQLKWIRSKIGLVSQEPVLFTASIKDNIAYGKDGATEEEIFAAVELANAKNFINELPQGLDTTVGERGIQLSGGQKQRVAIARAILKDPRILLLDEATSALDTDSERVVQEALDKVMVNRTTVIVAHRLSTIRNADMIAVLHQGKLVEKGTHFELLNDPQGVYSNIISSQEANKDDDQRIEHKAVIAVKSEMESNPRNSSHSLSSGSSGVGNVSNDVVPTSVTTLESRRNVDSLERSEVTQEVSIFRLAQLNRPELPVLIAATISACITGGIFPVFGFLISGAIKTFYEPPHKLNKDSKFWALMLCILGIASCLAYVARFHLWGVSGNKLITRIRFKCFQKVVNMEIGWFDKPENSSGVLSGKLSSDAAMMRALVGDTIQYLVHEIASVVVGLIIAFQASWRLSLIVVAMLPLLGFHGYIRMKSMRGFGKDAKMMYEEASQVANDAIGNIRTVASFCAEDKIIEMYQKKCEEPIANGTKQGLISGISFGVSMCFLYGVYAISFYAGARFVQDGKITIGDVFRVYYALTMVAIMITGTSSLATDTTKAKKAAASVFAILERKSMIDPSDESGMVLENINGEIELMHVNFSYPTRPGIQILKDLSLTIHSGKVVSLVGESGSGKSTVISLLQRFYNPNSGYITLDGIEIHKFQLKWLRQQIGLVSQEPILFNDTIRANIAIGKGGNATEAEIISAAKLANAHEFISGLQEGFNTIVGERGLQLSGGQKQRVAIARAIVKSPKILLLDEATSALDNESEKVVQEALNKVMLDKTTVVVAHRLSTIRGADMIAVFRNGNIIEKGNHNTLIEMKNGVYSSLVRLHTT